MGICPQFLRDGIGYPSSANWSFQEIKMSDGWRDWKSARYY